MIYFAQDPGGHTGFAEWNSETDEHRAWYLPADEAMSYLGARLADDPPDDFVTELIVINAQTHKKGQQVLLSVEQIGIARYLCWCHGVPFSGQRPSAMKFADDRKLKAMGWWTPGPTDHPRAASKHLLCRVCEQDADFASRVAARLSAE